jgi:hypothetical protein
MKIRNNMLYKSTLFTLGFALVLLGAGCQSSVDSNANNASSTPEASNSTTTGQGRVVFSITDAAIDMKGVSAVNLTVDKMEMHSAAKGWVVVSSDNSQYNLLALKAKGNLALAAQTQVAIGTYNQVRVHIKKVEVVKFGVKSEAVLPANNMEIAGQFTVARNAAASINLDFIADQSLRISTSGKFIFAPVVKIEARANADVSITSDNMVVVAGGVADSSATMGMDLDGVMHDNFKLDENSKLEIKDGKIIKVGGTVSANTDARVSVRLGEVLR